MRGRKKAGIVSLRTSHRGQAIIGDIANNAERIGAGILLDPFAKGTALTEDQATWRPQGCCRDKTLIDANIICARFVGERYGLSLRESFQTGCLFSLLGLRIFYTSRIPQWRRHATGTIYLH